MPRARSKRSLGRRKDSRSGRRILIVCEGQETEPRYFRALRSELKLGAVDVQVEGEDCGSAPISVVDFALRLKKRPPRGVSYDAVWCVIDRDGHQSFDKAIDKAQAHGIRMAVSVRQFELWFLLHFAYTTRVWTDGESLLEALAAHLPDYGKGTDVAAALRPLRPAALTNAERLRVHNAAVSDRPYPNPMTDVDLLVLFLIGLKP